MIMRLKAKGIFCGESAPLPLSLKLRRLKKAMTDEDGERFFW